MPVNAQPIGESGAGAPPRLKDRYDAVIIGAGHNGLVCACYLAGAGLSVCGGRAARRRRRRRGHRGIPSGLPQLDRELHGEPAQSEGDPRPAPRRARAARSSSARSPTSCRCRTATTSRWAAGSRRRSARSRASRTRDAERLPEYYARLERRGRRAARAAARDAAQRRRRHPRPLPRVEGRAGALNALPLAQPSATCSTSSRVRRDWLDRWFESEPIKACFGFDAVVGNFASPYTPGSAYVLLHHVFGEVNGKKGSGATRSAAWARSRRRCARGRGARRRDPHRRGRGARDRGQGRQRGRRRARRRQRDRGALRVVATSTRGCCPRAARRRERSTASADSALENYQCESATLRMNVALAELPDFTACRARGAAAPRLGNHHGAVARVHGPRLSRARAHGWSREPIVEMLIPTHRRRLARAAGQARREPLLPALPLRAAGRAHLGRRSAKRAADAVIDHGDALRAQLQRRGPRAARAHAARPRARVRPRGRRHLPRQAHAEPALQRAPGAGPRALPHAAEGAVPVRLGRASRAAA